MPKRINIAKLLAYWYSEADNFSEDKKLGSSETGVSVIGDKKVLYVVLMSAIASCHSGLDSTKVDV